MARGRLSQIAVSGASLAIRMALAQIGVEGSTGRGDPGHTDVGKTAGQDAVKMCY